MSVVSKSNKCETCQQKITNLLTNERHVFVGSYFCINVSCLLDFNTDVVSFDIKYFFLSLSLSLSLFPYLFIYSFQLFHFSTIAAILCSQYKK